MRASPARYASNCLLARRLAERGVRFIQLYHRGWDQHNDLPRDLALQCKGHRPAVSGAGAGSEAARPARRHARDLGRRVRPHGLLPGHAHRRRTTAATITRAASRCGWRAAASSRASTYGETDDFCYNVVKDPVHIHDLQATILQCLGIDHKRLTYKFQGRQFRLTDVHGNVMKELLV